MNRRVSVLTHSGAYVWICSTSQMPLHSLREFRQTFRKVRDGAKLPYDCNTDEHCVLFNTVHCLQIEKRGMVDDLVMHDGTVHRERTSRLCSAHAAAHAHLRMPFSPRIFPDIASRYRTASSCHSSLPMPSCTAKLRAG